MPAGFPKCTDGHPEDCSYTNSKVIVARSYTRLTGAGSNPANPAADSRPDDYSPRDREGHGTAIASVIAANPAKGVGHHQRHGAQGVAGQLQGFRIPERERFSAGERLIQAVNDAVKDGMDVVNLSSASPPPPARWTPARRAACPPGAPCDPIGLAFENAVESGRRGRGCRGQQRFRRRRPIPASIPIGTPATAPSVIAVGAVTNSHYFTPTVTVAGGPAESAEHRGPAGRRSLLPGGRLCGPGGRRDRAGQRWLRLHRRFRRARSTALSR